MCVISASATCVKSFKIDMSKNICSMMFAAGVFAADAGLEVCRTENPPAER